METSNIQKFCTTILQLICMQDRKECSVQSHSVVEFVSLNTCCVHIALLYTCTCSLPCLLSQAIIYPASYCTFSQSSQSPNQYILPTASYTDSYSIAVLPFSVTLCKQRIPHTENQLRASLKPIFSKRRKLYTGTKDFT